MKKKTIHLLVIVTLMFTAACGTDSTGNETATANEPRRPTKIQNKRADNRELAGTWVAKDLSYISKKDPSRTQDMKKMLKAAISMTIKTDGHYSYEVKMMGMTKTESGMMQQNGNRITTDNPDFKMMLSGKTLTLTVENQQWDFGQGKEAAISKAVFVRR